MALRCPKCGNPIAIYKIKSSFPCEHCSTKLKADFSSVAIGTVVLWSLAAIPLYLIFPDPGTGLFVIRMLFELGLGFLIFSYLARSAMRISEE
jgi:hypothetical protein